MVGGECKQTKVWMRKQTIDLRYLAERQQSVCATWKSLWHVKSSWLSVWVCEHVCVYVCKCVHLQALGRLQVGLCLTGECWSHFDEDELAVLWLAGVTVAESGGFSHSVQMSLFNQPLLNHMWGGKIKRHEHLHTFQKSRALFWAEMKSDDLKVFVIIVDH